MNRPDGKPGPNAPRAGRRDADAHPRHHGAEHRGDRRWPRQEPGRDHGRGARNEAPGNRDRGIQPWRQTRSGASSERNFAFEFFSAASYFAGVGADKRFLTNSELTAEHFNRLCTVQATAQYTRAFQRWEAMWNARGARLRRVSVHPRVLIGLSEANLWESGIALNLPYGMPLLPGSACKGLARHFSRSHIRLAADQPGLSEEINDALFGTVGGAGVVAFQDAWWVPESASPAYGAARPFVREVVTPHHKQFLESKGTVPATPFDSPEPSPQIAAHGSFLLVTVGLELWAEHALDILQLAMEFEGIGGRTPEYGRAERVAAETERPA